MTFRPINPSEMAMLDRMLSASFQGKDQLVEQVKSASVQTIDRNGSLRFTVPSTSTTAKVSRRVPVAAQCFDSDSTSIHALLHIVAGKVIELEIYKDDSSAVLRKVDADEWEVFALD